MYIEQLRVALDRIEKLGKSSGISEDLLRYLVRGIWQSVRFLSGSTTKRIPYEVTYALHRALADWTNDSVIVTTALLEEPNYYFMGSTPDLTKWLAQLVSVNLDDQIIQIAFPAIYRRTPAFCIPLYHELGHFVDVHLRIVDASELLHKLQVDPRRKLIESEFGTTDVDFVDSVLRAHRREFFADAFCACYTGDVGGDFLRAFAGNESLSQSHPSVQERTENIANVLSGAVTGTYSMLRDVVQKFTQQDLLVPKFSSVDVTTSFNAARPVDLSSQPDVHGIFSAGWKYLETVSKAPVGRWSKVSDVERSPLVNGLIEKSIRNFMIREGWESAIASA